MTADRELDDGDSYTAIRGGREREERNRAVPPSRVSSALLQWFSSRCFKHELLKVPPSSTSVYALSILHFRGISDAGYDLEALNAKLTVKGEMLGLRFNA